MKIVDESELTKLRHKKKVDFKEYSKTSAIESKPEPPKNTPREDSTIKIMDGIVSSLKETVLRLNDKDDTSIIHALTIMQENFNKSLETALSSSKREPQKEKIIIQDRVKKWSFSIKRNDRGYIEEIIAEAKD